jgi:phage baseplate assembly protein gpV
MPIDNWNQSKFAVHKVKNGSRRGYLQKTYGDKKMQHVRLSTGHQNTNDKIEHVQPAGFLGRHAPGEKVEILTKDIGGDTSHRVAEVIGDREHHPKIDEAESILYSPGDKQNYMRIKGTKKEQQGQGRHGSGAEFEDPYDGDGKEDKNPKGIHAASEADETHTIKGTHQVHAEKDVRAKAPKIHFKGEVHIDGTLFVKQGLKPGGGPWGDGNPDAYPGSKQTTRDPPPLETEPGPVIESHRPPAFFIDDEGGVVFPGKVTFKGAVHFSGPVTFDDVVEFPEGGDGG